MKPIKGGRVITTVANQEIITDKENGLRKVVICNQSDNEIHIIVNNGNQISLEIDESISFGSNIKIVSIIIVERGSKIRYIGV